MVAVVVLTQMHTNMSKHFKPGDLVFFKVPKSVDGGGVKMGVLTEISWSFIGKDHVVDWQLSTGRLTQARLTAERLFLDEESASLSTCS